MQERVVESLVQLPLTVPDSEFLLLKNYHPQSELILDQEPITRAKFPTIDAHNHLGRWFSNGKRWNIPDVGRLVEIMDRCNIQSMVNLDGLWGDELEANLRRYDLAHPGRFITFAQCQWEQLVWQPNFGKLLADQLKESIERGAKGLKIWKDLGLKLRDSKGQLIPPNDKRLSPLWTTAADFDIPVLIHTADPVAFFKPLDPTNERYEEIVKNPSWHVYGPEFPKFELLIEQFADLVGSNPTTFIAAHLLYPENLKLVTNLLRSHPNLYLDMSARLAELGRQPFTAKKFLEEFSDRIMFGLDSHPTAEKYSAYFTVFETDNEYIPYSPEPETYAQGRWDVYGIKLPDEKLKDLYTTTASKLIHI